MHGALKLILGLIFIVLGIYSYVAWNTFLEQLIMLIKLIVWNWGLWLALIGLVMLLLGASDLKG